jgi:hypothetical protein
MQDREIRRVLNQKIIEKRLRLLKNLPSCNRPDSSGKTYYEKMKHEPGRMRDKPPLDCGNSRCMICHSDKLSKKLKASDIRKL